MTTITAIPRALSRTRLLAAAAIALAILAVGANTPQANNAAPETLQETGLYSDFPAHRIDDKHLAFSPQYPLWTDGATKRRWISLPPGTAIDASDPDAWVFPVGTRLWKEFSFAGQRVETRYMELRPDGWLYAAYAWSADGRETQRVSARGRRNAYLLEAGRSHAIPGVSDCKACHQGGRGEVLGFGTVQLAPQRDPHALHADASSGIDLGTLIERGLLVGLPASLQAPTINATSPVERAALGYLHGNCGHCHNEQGPLRNVGLFLRQSAGATAGSTIDSTVDQPLRKPLPGTSDATLRIAPGDPDRSALMRRIASRLPVLQMPPLGTELVDRQAVDLLRRWIEQTEPTFPPRETTH